MIFDRAYETAATWFGGLTWLLRLNRRLEAAAARWRPVRVLLATLAAVTRNDAQQLNAGMAYYGMVSLIPVSVALLQFASFTLGREWSSGWFESWTSGLFPPTVDLGNLVVAQDAALFGITGGFALLGLVWGSYKLFGSVGVVVNRMWGIAPAQVGIIGKTRQYLLMSGTAAVLLFSSVITYAISQDLIPWLLHQLGLADRIGPVISSAARGWWSNMVAGLLSLAAFIVVYRYVPERRVRWRWAIIGAIIASVALQAISHGLFVFLAYVAPSHLLYGSLASILIVLVWLFASAVTLASGAAVGAYCQSVYDGDGPTPGPGWFLK